jgi:hypothetical protein
MKASSIAIIALSFCVSSALLAGCGGSQMYGNAPAPGSAARTGSRVSPAIKQLLYISDYKAATVYFYDYPSLKEAGTLTGFGAPAGECSDSSGNVWITDSKKQEIVEYAHGGSSPITTLSDAGFEPYGCAIDPTTGNLAVTNLKSDSGKGNLAIYPGATGPPTLYTDPDIEFYYFCSYDKDGRLTVDGALGGVAVLADLPAGGSKLETLTIDKSFPGGGGLEWTGTTLIVGERRPKENYLKIFRFTIEGKKATLKGSGPLNDNKSLEQFILRGPTLITTDKLSGTVYLYRYPKTGAPFKSITGLSEPFGAALSVTQ